MRNLDLAKTGSGDGESLAWHALPGEEAVSILASDGTDGLSEQEAERKLTATGPNRLTQPRRVTFWAVAREEIAEPMILLLLAVGVLYALWGETQDALAIFAIILGIVAIEVYNEYRAKAAIAALGHLVVPEAPVVRDGRARRLPTAEIVPGDLLLLRAGERVPADARLLAADGLRLNESGLTGESAPVDKAVAPVPAATDLGDRHDMVYTGTMVVGGSGRGVVVATGMATELGRIAGLVREAREPRTPLQLAMRQLSGWLVWVALGFSVLVPALGYLFGQPLQEMVLTGLTLAFATIPEELPILISVVLGLGALRLSRRHAIVKRLRAAETLGSVSAVASDKTGTITENRMALERAYAARAFLTAEEVPASPVGRRLLEVGVLASDPALVAPDGDGHGGFTGDPTEVALVAAAAAAGINPQMVRGDGPLVEFAFANDVRATTAVYARGGEWLVVTKGAPESVVELCRREASPVGVLPFDGRARKLALAAADAMAAQGLRVLALASKSIPPAAAPLRRQQAESDLVFLGLAGLLDPPRPEVAPALAELQKAGIRVLMVTGDHPATARAVATAVGLPAEPLLVGQAIEAMPVEALREAARTTAVYARIAPEHKLRIVEALQANGAVVAVTGDGINDAPALKQAQIGVAMGERGTDAAREAADIVLADDNFATIAVAVREGRVLFANLRKAVRYYLAAKTALVVSSLAAVLAHLPVPFAPIQIIVMELFMDLAASVAFTTERPEADVMRDGPRDPRRPFMDGPMRYGIFAGGLSLAAAVVAVYFWAWGQTGDARHAQTMGFAIWMIGHLALAAYMRSERQPLLRLGLLSNRAFSLWAVSAVGTVLAAVYLPGLQNVLRTVPLAPGDWLAIVGAAVLAPLWLEIVKVRRWRG